jgi:hypothetical protein
MLMSSNEENDTPAQRTLVSNNCLVVVKLFLTDGIRNRGRRLPPAKAQGGDGYACEFNIY